MKFAIKECEKHKTVPVKSKDREYGYDVFMLCRVCARVVGRANFEDLKHLEKEFLERIKNSVEVKEIRAINHIKSKKWKEYEKYLGTSAWRKKRIEIILRCNNICEMCHEKEVEHVHHVNYESVGNENPEDLLGLCKKCHRSVHGGRRW